MADAKKRSDSPELFGKTAALALCVCLLAGLAGQTAFTFHDTLIRLRLEKIVEPTGVGDASFFTPPGPLDPQKPVAFFQGKSLFMVSSAPIKLHDSKAIRVGMDDSGSSVIYRPSDSAAVVKGSPEYLLKIDRDRYMKVKSAQ